MTVRDILAFLDTCAPFATAEEWDNPGLLVGDAAAPVSRVLVALDVTPGALKAAQGVGANLLITHHPVIFAPLKRLESSSMPYRLAGAGIALIAAHTNLDKTAGGVNDTLAARLGLTDVQVAEDGMTRIGTLPQEIAPAAFAGMVNAALGTASRLGRGEKPIRTVAVCGGSGGDLIPALAGKVDAFVTGEVKHHQWLEAESVGLTVLESGHYATEAPVVDTLCSWLSDAFPALSVLPYYEGEPYSTVK